MPKRFYCIDDDQDILAFLRMAFELDGHQVTTFQSGLDALEAIRKSPPDCVLTDIMMPGLDGIQLCQQLRAEERFRDLCILVVSGKVYQTDRQRALEAGANGFIQKARSDPFQIVSEVMAFFNETLAINFWGCRGTMPVPGPDTVRYGGDTCCVSLTFPDGHVFVFDAGTGIRSAAHYLMAKKRKLTGTVLLSHPHWDHLNFIPFFTPLFVPGNKFEIVGHPHGDLSVKKLVADQMDGVHFPISPAEFGADVSYRDIGEGTYALGPAQVQTKLLCHPGYCLGYRVTYKNRVFCYVTDNELFPADSDGYSANYVRTLCEFVDKADVLITDITYFDEEYPKKMGWGHSSVGPATELACAAGVKELFLFHHAPEHDDDAIDRKLDFANSVAARLGSNTVCRVAAAQELIELKSSS